jgi:hypothetical protein
MMNMPQGVFNLVVQNQHMANPMLGLQQFNEGVSQVSAGQNNNSGGVGGSQIQQLSTHNSSRSNLGNK